MTLIWDKIGHVYAPDGKKEWMSSHASNTVPIHRGRGIFEFTSVQETWKEDLASHS